MHPPTSYLFSNLPSMYNPPLKVDEDCLQATRRIHSPLSQSVCLYSNSAGRGAHRGPHSPTATSDVFSFKSFRLPPSLPLMNNDNLAHDLQMQDDYETRTYPPEGDSESLPFARPRTPSS